MKQIKPDITTTFDATILHRRRLLQESRTGFRCISPFREFARWCKITKEPWTPDRLVHRRVNVVGKNAVLFDGYYCRCLIPRLIVFGPSPSFSPPKDFHLHSLGFAGLAFLPRITSTQRCICDSKKAKSKDGTNPRRYSPHIVVVSY